MNNPGRGSGADEFPPYTYTPGVTPHPIRDPQGHSYGRTEPVSEKFDPQRWRDCATYVHGLRLFNRGYYWEAHEAWEAAWHSVGRRGITGDFLKGLIKWAAAGVKVREGRPNGVRRHLRRAAELIGEAAREFGGEELAGQSLPQLLEALQAAVADAYPETIASSGPPVAYWKFQLTEQ